MATSNPFGDPVAQALLGLSQGLLAAGAPHPFPQSVGGALSQGIGGALSGAMGAQRYNLAQQQADLMKLQNLMLGGKVDFLFGNGQGGSNPASNPGGVTNVPVPSLGMNVPMAAGGGTAAPAAPAPAYAPRFPVLPGFENDPKMSDAAWMGFVPSRVVSSYVGASTKNPLTVDRGNTIELRDQRDPNKVIATLPKGAAPASVPYTESDIPPSEARKFQLDLRKAGAVQVQNNVNTQLPASEAAQKDFMDKTAKNYDALRTAPVAISNIEKARDIAKSGNPFIGSFGTQKAAIAQFFNNNLGTTIAPDQIANAGELKNRLFQQIMDNLKKMDAQPSQLQQQLMMDALGNLNTDPGALDKVLGVTEEIIRGKVALHNKEAQSGIQRGVKFPYNPIIDLPPSTSNFPKPSPDAINRLKMNPKESSQFEAVFGPGSAKQYLGR